MSSFARPPTPAVSALLSQITSSSNRQATHASERAAFLCTLRTSLRTSISNSLITIPALLQRSSSFPSSLNTAHTIALSTLRVAQALQNLPSRRTPTLTPTTFPADMFQKLSPENLVKLVGEYKSGVLEMLEEGENEGPDKFGTLFWDAVGMRLGACVVAMGVASEREGEGQMKMDDEDEEIELTGSSELSTPPMHPVPVPALARRVPLGAMLSTLPKLQTIDAGPNFIPISITMPSSYNTTTSSPSNPFSPNLAASDSETDTDVNANPLIRFKPVRTTMATFYGPAPVRPPAAAFHSRTTSSDLAGSADDADLEPSGWMMEMKMRALAIWDKERGRRNHEGRDDDSVVSMEISPGTSPV